MQNDYDTAGMLKTVTAELREWKTIMQDLAYAFYRQFPAIRKYGWTLHLRKCAESKRCEMCPHSIIWARYYYVKLSEEKKKEIVNAGKEAPKWKMSWDNSEEGNFSNRLPKRLRVSRKDHGIYREFEAVRIEIMAQHRELGKLRKKLANTQQHFPPGHTRPVSYFTHPLLRTYFMVVLPSLQIKQEVIRKIKDLRAN